MIPFIEKYRPDNINDIILNEQNYSIFNYFITNKTLPNLLFFGPPGTGKTSSVLALSKSIYKTNYRMMVLELNASDNRNINVVRKIIKEFASTQNLFTTGFKLVILDEVDSMTYDAQFCLRRIMETYSKNVRFCFICNYISKIIPALKSRCSIFKFGKINNSDIKKKIKYILKKENIDLSDQILKEIIKNANKDIRKILNLIQIFLYHKPKLHMTSYYGILGVPNLNYIRKIYNFSIKINDIDDILKIEDKLIYGIKKGYYDINIFCNIFYNYIIDDSNIKDDKKIMIIERLAEIELYHNKISKLSFLIHYLLEVFLVGELVPP